MTADVNVAEKVAGALHKALAPVWMSVARALGGDQAQYESMLNDLANAAFSVLADPEVLAGIAGVLRDTYARTTCGGDPTTAGEVSDWLSEAAAVVEWLNRRA